MAAQCSYNMPTFWVGYQIMHSRPRETGIRAITWVFRLSAGACALIRRFLELDEDIQQAFVDYAVQVANE